MAKENNLIHLWMGRLGLVLALVASPTAGHCSDDLVTSQLVDEARVWQSKGRPDLASNVWRRILVTNPQHAEALTSLGIIEAKAGHLEEAQALYVRAKRAAKNSPTLGRLEEMVAPTGSVIESAGPPPRAAVASSSQTKRLQEKDARPIKLGANSSPMDYKPTGEKSQKKVTAPPPAEKVRTTTTLQAPSVAHTPVLPPSTEVRVTPLPLPQISGSRIAANADTDATEDISLKASSTLKNNASPTGTVSTTVGPSTTNKKRPKPCRLPLATAPITS